MAGAIWGAACIVAISDGPGMAAEPVATFSVVGYDSATGDLGIAVQSKFFAVGAVVPWAKAGVGAIATQAFANTTFGPRGLELLAQGHDAAGVTQLLTESDSLRERRQLGVVDAHGRAASFTGKDCMAWAGHESGDGFTVQGNILASPEVVAAMARAWRETRGMVGDRLLAALEAGQAAGGDSRGQQSAALLVVREGGGYGGFNDRWCDLRVDDHATPIAELRRVYSIWKKNVLILDGYRLCDEGRWDAAFEAGREAVALAPKEGEPHYHYACYLSKAGRKADALQELERALVLDAKLAAQARTDPDFEPLREDAVFRKLVGL